MTDSSRPGASRPSDADRDSSPGPFPVPSTGELAGAIVETVRKVRTYAHHLTGVLDVDALDERTRSYPARLPEAVERMQGRIHDLLQLARVGRTEPDRRETSGNGVGLALCRRIAEHHHGQIRAEGRPGAGARFIITLPSSRSPEAR